MFAFPRDPFSNILKIKTGKQSAETNRAKLDQTCLAALIIHRVQRDRATRRRGRRGCTLKIARSRFSLRDLLSVHLHTWRTPLRDVSLSVPLPPRPALDFSSSSSSCSPFTSPSIWKLFRAVEDGENWPISLPR